MASAPSHYHLSPRSLLNESPVQKAQELMVAAVIQQSAYNAYHVAHPRRSTYGSRLSGPSRKRSGYGQSPAAPEFSAKLKAAAALLAENQAR